MSASLAESAAVLVADLRRDARNAARRNKPTMWAYFHGVANRLEGLLAEADDAECEKRLRAIIYSAELLAPESTTSDAARMWAEAIYARRLLRSHGLRVARPSLEWLHLRAAG